MPGNNPDAPVLSSSATDRANSAAAAGGVEGGGGGSNTTGASLSVPLLRVCCGLLPLHSLLGADDDDVASSVAVVKDVTLCSSVRPSVGMPRLSGDGGELGLLPPPPPREKSGMAGAEEGDPPTPDGERAHFPFGDRGGEPAKLVEELGGVRRLSDGAIEGEEALEEARRAMVGEAAGEVEGGAGERRAETTAPGAEAGVAPGSGTSHCGAELHRRRVSGEHSLLIP